MTTTRPRETPDHYHSLFYKRFRVLTVCFCLCAAVIIGRVIFLCVVKGNTLRNRSAQLSQRHYPLPAARGKILFSDGTPAAWDEPFFDLQANISKLTLLHQQAITAVLPRCRFDGKTAGFRTICKNLTEAEIHLLYGLIQKKIPLKIHSGIRRRTVENPELQKKIGKTRDGKGISGWEKEYDHLLAGIPGHAEVTIDRKQQPIQSTLQILQTPEHGKDVVLPMSPKSERDSHEN